jgi:hypothetical protein
MEAADGRTIYISAYPYIVKRVLSLSGGRPLRFPESEYTFRDDARPAPTVQRFCNRTVERYRSLPYGVGCTRDDRVLWFDRRCMPLAWWSPEGTFTPLDGSWITFRPVVWFYNDSCPPRTDLKTRRFLEDLLRKYPDLANSVAMRFAAVTGKRWPGFATATVH